MTGHVLRNALHVFAAIATLFVAQFAGAAELRSGKDFLLINPPLAVESRGKIEVLEFFWYGCSHCNDFEPVLSEWQKKLPPDVTLRRVPAVFPNMKWAPGAKIFYTLEAMGLVEKLHAKVFNAIHEERLRLDDDIVLLDWAGKQGIDRAKFKEVMTSFAVNSRIQQARTVTVASDISGVPAIVVHGRYLAITPGNYGDLIKNVDRLIDVARAEAGSKK